jgi:O-antigen ligase
MKAEIIFFGVFFVLLINPLGLMLGWIITSPFVSNFIERPGMNPFFGSYMIFDYSNVVLQGFDIRELFDFDRIVLLLLFFITLVSKNKAGTRIDRVDVIFFIFLLILFFSALRSHNVIHAIRIVLDTFGLCYVAYYLGKTSFHKKRLFEKYVAAVIVLGCILIAVGLIEKYFIAKSPSHRITGPFAYWETFGLTLTIIFFHLWYKITAMVPQRILERIILKGLMVLTIFCITMTYTRTIIFSALMGLIGSLYMGRRIISRKTINKYLAVSVVLIITIMTFPVLVTDSDFYQNRLIQATTIFERVEAYKVAVRMFIQNPIFGIGLLNYQSEMKNYISRSEIVFTRLGQTTSHNSFLAVAAESGLFGIVAMVLLIAVIYKTCYKYYKLVGERNEKIWGLAMLAISISYFLSAMTFNMFFLPTIDNKIYYLSLGITVGRCQKLNSASTLQNSGP